MLLYELQGIAAQLQEMDLDDETLKDTLEAMDFQNSVEENIEYYSKIAKNDDAEIDMIDAEIKRLQERKQSKVKHRDYMKDRVYEALQLSGQNKISVGVFTVSLRKSEAVNILDETKIPVQYMTEKTTITPNKTDIKKTLKAGEVIEGTEIVSRENVQIK